MEAAAIGFIGLALGLLLGAVELYYAIEISRRDLVGIDIGYTRAVHTIWRVYSLGSMRGVNDLSGTYVGEQGTVAAGGQQAGGNWIYGGPSAEIGMIASGVTKDAGYNLATGVAAMTIKLRP